VPYSLNLQGRAAEVAAALQRAMDAPGEDLAPAALAIAAVEYPFVDEAAYRRELDRLGTEARERVGSVSGGTHAGVSALNEYLYDELGFRGDLEHYHDPRNSFLNEVLDRRMGIPISLAVIYLEVARRIGLRVSGINFPGHFLLRAPLDGEPGTSGRDFLIIDPFHGGALLSESDCRELLLQHVGEAAAFDAALLDPASRHDIIARMLVNLKRLYVRMRSFPQARFISDLLVTVDPSAVSELRDRGLLAYHLEDYSSALRDLEAYLRGLPRHRNPSEAAGAESRGADEEEDDQKQIWEHVKALRKRVAAFN
jgi:regulator of sirC expression with transglutaminase-like and TPR domain